MYIKRTDYKWKLFNFMRHILLFFLFFLFYGCKLEQSVNGAVYNIDLDSLERTTVPQLSSLRYVFLETNEHSLINNINRLFYCNQKIYLFDDRSKQILCFDDNGKFLFKIHSVGQGPGEYLYPVDMDVDNNGDIYINDPVSKRIMRYKNGDKNKSEIIPINKRALDFFIMPHSVYFSRVHNKESFLSSLVSMNLDTNENRIWSECDWDKKNEIPYSSKHYIFRSGETAFYYERFHPVVYKIDNDSVYEFVDFYSSGIPTKSDIIRYTKESSEEFMKPGIIREVSAFFETGDYYYVSFKSFPALHVLINKQTGIAYDVSEIYETLIRGSETVAVNRNELITFCNPNPDKIKKFLTEMDVPEIDKSRLMSLKEDDNPFLIFYSFDK